MDPVTEGAAAQAPDSTLDPTVVAIADYGLLSDCQGAALVGKTGSIDWACLPRFDSPAIFGRLLDPGAGYWQIAPTRPAETRRSYVDDTLILRTEMETCDGRVALDDALAFGPTERGHHIGHDSPHVILRRVEGIAGEVEMSMVFAPRPGYGLTSPLIVEEPGGVRTQGGPFSLVLSTTLPLTVCGSEARTTFRVRAGETVHLAAAVCSPWEPPPPHLEDEQCRLLLDATAAAWRSWSSLHQSYDGPYEDLVRHSGRVLQALTFAPTGAIVAAPTTSLPETIGGTRNWDYRFSWIRDASLTLEALWVAACPDEADDFFSFIATAAGGHLPDEGHLQILYGVGGERLVPEHELDHLRGYRDSRPVRIGNAAWCQSQLDVYGELLNAAWLLADEVGTFDEVTSGFLVDAANAAALRWKETDQGIWEVRGAPRHFVHSKLMCWVALDRAIRLVEKLGAEGYVEQWSEARAEIRSTIEELGWNEAAGAFTQAFGSEELDASALMLLLTGFLPPDDPRMRSTVDAIVTRLSDERGFVYRYLGSDDLPGDEGTFSVCTFWLVQSLAAIGEIGRARELFERVTSYANDVGLFSEELDPVSGELLGNFPQAFTHIGLVNAAWAIAQAEGKAPKDLDAPRSVSSRVDTPTQPTRG